VNGINSATMKFVNISVFLVAVSAITSGCVPGKRPFLIVQVCLPKAQDLAVFKEEMQSIAHAEGLSFIDASANTQKDLESMDNPNVAKAMYGPLVNMGIERSDGVGLTAGNLGMPANQLVVGFSEGSDPAYAHRFADGVVDKLKQHWHVEMVPPGLGATGMKSCDSAR
jgi:hypothetical protein